VTAAPKSLYRRLESLLEGLPEGALVDDARACEALLERLRGELGTDALALLREDPAGFVLLAESGSGLEEPARGAEGWPAGVTVVPQERRRAATGGEPSAAIRFRSRGRELVLLARASAEVADEDLELQLGAVHSVLTIRLLEERLGGTLAQAAEIQGSLLPRRPPASAAYDVAFRYEPAEEVGGDVVDFIQVDDETLALVIGDASGHGLPAALLVRDVLIGLRMGIERELKPDFVLSKLNRVIHASSLSSSFVSLFYGELESNGSLFFFSAGHEPALLFDGDEVRLLRSRDTVVGPLSDVRFKRQFAHVDRGATLVLYTDGLVEARSSGGELFGLERLTAAARRRLGASSEEIVAGVFEDLEAFRGPGRERDDATLLVVHRRAEPAPRVS